MPGHYLAPPTTPAQPPPAMVRHREVESGRRVSPTSRAAVVGSNRGRHRTSAADGRKRCSCQNRQCLRDAAAGSRIRSNSWVMELARTAVQTADSP